MEHGTAAICGKPFEDDDLEMIPASEEDWGLNLEQTW